MLGSIITKLRGFNSTKVVILVRTDLNMGKGKIASQVAHAAVILYKNALEHANPHLNTWLSNGQPKIILKIENNCEVVIDTIFSAALSNNLNVCKVVDAGKTQIERGSVTVVGIGPNDSEEIDKITSGFKLL